MQQIIKNQRLITIKQLREYLMLKIFLKISHSHLSRVIKNRFSSSREYGFLQISNFTFYSNLLFRIQILLV